MQRIAVFLSLLAFAFAQVGPQGYSVYQLQNGVAYTGALPIQTSSDYGYNVDLYSFFVPENTSGVNVTITNNNSGTCSYLYLFIRSTSGLPCNYYAYDYNEYLCTNSYRFESYIGSSETDVLISGDDSDLFEFNVNSNWYFGVSRYYQSDYDELCGYTIQVGVNSSCTPGSVGFAQDLSSSYATQCSTPYTVVNTSSVVTLAANTNQYNVYKINVPTSSVGYILFTLNSTVTSSYIYGKSYGAPSQYSSSYNCYTGSYTTVNGFYIYNLYCYTPRKGDFFFILEDSATYSASIKFSMLQCAPGMGGYNCTFPAIPFNTSLAGQTFFIAPQPNVLSYPFVYMYLDIPANYTGAILSLTASSAESAYFYLRKEGFPEYSSTYGYEGSYGRQSTPGTFTLSQFEYAVAGRYYFALDCESTYGCNITFSANITTTGITSNSGVSTSTSNTGVSTSTSNTGATTTTTTLGTTGAVVTGGSSTANEVSSSPAEIIVPSVAIVAAAFAAVIALF
jgi:hypothetical protein